MTSFAVPPQVSDLNTPCPPSPPGANSAPAAWKRPWESGSTKQGPPFVGNTSWDGFCSQRSSGEGFSFDLYLLLLGLCLAAREVWDQRAAVLLL